MNTISVVQSLNICKIYLDLNLPRTHFQYKLHNQMHFRFIASFQFYCVIKIHELGPLHMSPVQDRAGPVSEISPYL